MADDTTPHPTVRQEFPGRGNRPGHQHEGGHREAGRRDGGERAGGQRDAGGFRIRLSDNEMQAARALQEAFGLRSTVAVLGFALRTLAQQLEEGQLEELVARHRAQGSQRGPGPQGGERRRERVETGEARGARAQRIDPFARPGRPPAVTPEAPPEAPVVEAAETSGAALESGEASDAAAAESAHGPTEGTAAEVTGEEPAEA